MKNQFIALLIMITSFCYGQDKKGCETIEPTYINRLPGYRINDCEESEYKEPEFIYYTGSPAKAVKIDKGGKYRQIIYFKNEGETRKFSSAEILNNYFNAITKVKGIELSKDKTMFKASINGKEVYIQIKAGNSSDVSNYIVEILEVEPMQQDIKVDLKEAIDSDGKIALYGILFDVNKATIKSESEKALQSVIDYLVSNPSVKIIVVGHTDNTGIFASNIALSKERAKAVVEYLVTKGKINASRLMPDGVGSLCPVSTNTTEAGKNLNRRVEIVKQ
ncbi:MAG: OmpA family protein [Sphingobacteriaceae bacterium]|nr:OmpA family protein [Sphingobacteriaceae bacterium]